MNQPPKEGSGGHNDCFTFKYFSNAGFDPRRPSIFNDYFINHRLFKKQIFLTF